MTFAGFMSQQDRKWPAEYFAGLQDVWDPWPISANLSQIGQKLERKVQCGILQDGQNHDG